MNKLPTAKQVRTSDVQTIWFVQWPSDMRKQGKSYYVTTYPNSDLIFIETAAKRRQVSSLVARKIAPEMRAAIVAAGGKA